MNSLNRPRGVHFSPRFPLCCSVKLWKMLKTRVSFERHCGNLQRHRFVKRWFLKILQASHQALKVIIDINKGLTWCFTLSTQRVIHATGQDVTRSSREWSQTVMFHLKQDFSVRTRSEPKSINIFARFSPTFVRFPESILQRFPHFLNRKWKTLKSPCGKLCEI